MHDDVEKRVSGWTQQPRTLAQPVRSFAKAVLVSVAVPSVLLTGLSPLVHAQCVTPAGGSAVGPGSLELSSAVRSNTGPAFGPRRDLLATPDLAENGWTVFSSKPAAEGGATWNVTRAATGEMVLVCTGQPYGYLKTREAYDDFEFGLEWRYPDDEHGNSGILIYTDGEDRIWPRAVQVQLHHPSVGNVFPSGDAITDNVIKRAAPTLKRPTQWNACVITSRDGVVTVSINGTAVGQVTGCNPRHGHIALQSEGSVVHFRNMWMRVVDEDHSPAPDAAESQAGGHAAELN